jgi:hypothetical protein
MTAIAHRPAAFEICTPSQAHRRQAAADRVLLRPTEDGWSLIAQDGAVVFRGLGRAGRRECLQYAYSLGVLSVHG